MYRYVPKTYNNRRILRVILRIITTVVLIVVVLFVVLFFWLQNYLEFDPDGAPPRLVIPWMNTEEGQPEEEYVDEPTVVVYE